jgi:4-amino-4-deoxy-L-arabinose transferase-like glycosyltransferase
MSETDPSELPQPETQHPELTWLDRRLLLGFSGSAVLLALIALLAAFLRFYHLSAIGDGNPYYTAAVRSMLTSWKNFFFAAAEPGGSVSIDKPPLGFWFQVLSARLFGVNGFAVALPQILAGILSVILLYFLVKRCFGPAAGLLAAFVLAVTPIFIAADRSNEIDGTLVLALLLAAWAFLRAADRGSLGYLILGAVFVGLGFNIKMLEAYLPLPALYALYFFGAARPWRVKAAHLAAATAVLLIVSFSWAAAVDLTPANERPYVGSSQHNSVIELALGYNGLARVLGLPFFAARPPANPAGPVQPTPGAGMAAEFTQYAARFAYFDSGRPGPLRLFSLPLAKETSWLLPFALLAILLAAVREPVHFPLSPQQRSLLLWDGWLLTGVVFFSIASFMHTYYLVTLVPPLAAMTAIGADSLWKGYAAKPRRTALLLLFSSGLTLAFQTVLARILTPSTPWAVPAIVLLLAGAALALIGLRPSAALPRGRQLATGGVLAAILIAPTAWGVLTTLDPNPNDILPAAYAGRLAGFSNVMQILMQFSAPDPALVAYLQSHTQGQEYLLAAPNALFGSTYILETGRPVLLMGGFIGIDPVVNAQQMAALVGEHRLSYVWDSFGILRFVKPDVYRWLQSSCTVVEQVPVPSLSVGTLTRLGRIAQEMGAVPDTPRGIPNTGSATPSAMPQNALYHCGN